MTDFPPALPASLDDPEVIRSHDWQAFHRLSLMENHWQRRGWTPGRRSYHWMLGLDGADDVQRLAQQCQMQLPPAVLDLVPLDALHLTMGRIGFTDELARTAALTVADEAVLHCRESASFPLTVGPLAGSKGALRFSVVPWSSISLLHRQLTTATRAVLGEQCVMDTSRFRPHLSIAYVNTAVPVASLLPTLEQLRAPPTVAVTVSSVALVELRREERTYRYEEVDRMTLSQR